MDKFTLNVSKPVEELVRAIFGEGMSDWEKHLQTKVLLTNPSALQHLDSLLAVLREGQARGSEGLGMLVSEDHLKQCATFLRAGTSWHDLGTLRARPRPTTLTLRTCDLALLLCISIFGTIPICSDKSGENLHFIDDIERAMARLLPVFSYGSPGCREVSIVTPGQYIHTRHTYLGRQIIGGGETAVVKLITQHFKNASHLKEIRQRKIQLSQIPRSQELLKTSQCIYDVFDASLALPFLVINTSDQYSPLSEQLARDPDSLVIMAKQMIECIHDLRYKARVVHRDISISTIMHTKDGGMDKFILVDSGFSILVDESSMSLPVGSPLRHHTRMLPFMARELVSDMAASQSSWRRSAHRPVQHCIRHDFESLFWVSLWCAIAVVSPGMEDPAQKIKGLKFLATWEMPSLRSTADRKHAIITDGGDALKKVPLSPSFKHLREWFRAFRSCFFEALVAQFRWKERKDTAPPFESFETGHGNVTRDEIFEAFTRYDESESVV